MGQEFFFFLKKTNIFIFDFESLVELLKCFADQQYSALCRHKILCMSVSLSVNYYFTLLLECMDCY